MRNLANFLVHLFNRDGEAERTYLSVVHDRCLFCEELISDSPSYLTYRVCPFCRFHYTVTARERIELLVDKETFKEMKKLKLAKKGILPRWIWRRGNQQRKYLLELFL